MPQFAEATHGHDLPPTRDISFWGLTVTQFLGAFNDNLFRQLVLLMCVDLALDEARAEDLQGWALVVFAVPFVLFSGFAGFISDRTSKRKIVVLCKLAEVAITLVGMLAFLSGHIGPLLFVLFLMGTHSAFFGPAKYGILPEMLKEHDLPRANGIIAMTTFLAIIFGLAGAGLVRDWFEGRLWQASFLYISTAIVGTLTSLLVKPTPIAQPGLRFRWVTLFVYPDTLRLLLGNRDLLKVLLISSVFWLVGGVVYPPAINRLAREQLLLSNTQTGQLAACTGVGICVGCVLAGRLSRNEIKSWLVRLGAWGMAASLLVLAIPNHWPPTMALGRDTTLLGVWGGAVALGAVGLFAGFFSVPLQVYLQARPPDTQKGRMIGTMNLVNWIGIAISGLLYTQINAIVIRCNWPPSMIFAFAAALMVPVAVFYRPPDVHLK